VALWAAVVPTAAQAQYPPPASPAPTGVVHADGSSGTEGGVVPAGCASCGGGLLGGMPAPGLDGGCVGCGGGCGGGCGDGCGGPCYPGMFGCDCCCAGTNPVSRLFCGLYNCICCNDPCYEPRWVPLANAAFFVDPTRPATQIRIRADFASMYQFPDKDEFFWAQENKKGPPFPKGAPGLLPAPAGTSGTSATPSAATPSTTTPGAPGATGATIAPGESNVDYARVYLYNEVGVQRFSFFTEISYLSTEPTRYGGSAGFADMNLGTKSLLLDCELIQIAFQFKTYLPTGNFTAGLGTGHVSLEPSLLSSLKITPTTYLQSQFAFWGPIGGTAGFQDPIFHYHFSLNQLLWSCGKDIQLIGTGELVGYALLGGAYTSPLTGLQAPGDAVTQILQAGPGLRLSICNKIDCGGGAVFQITRDRMEKVLGRIEFRWRF
jgi:hypothetical protein